MIDLMASRRNIVALLSLLALAACMVITGLPPLSPITATAADAKAKSAQEYYELRVYRIADAEKKKIVSTYLEKHWCPL
jgi:hypothetical protein